MIKLSGINVIMQKGEIFCLSQSIFCGTNGDLCLFKINDETLFKKGKTCEYLNFPKHYKFYSDENFKINSSFVCYFHMKFQKSDFGFGVYGFSKDKPTNYYAKTKIFIYFSRLLPLDYVFSKYRISLENSHIKFHKSYKNYKKEFIKAIKASEGRSSIDMWFSEIKLFLKIKILQIIKRIIK